MNRHKIYLLALLLLAPTQNAFSQEEGQEASAPSTMEELLELVKEGKAREQSENAKREKEFLDNKNQQAQLLEREKREEARQERIAAELEAEFTKNEEILRVKDEAYKKELGSLIELFGHLQSTSSEASVQFMGSLSSAEFGEERVIYLNELTAKMSETTELPDIEEIRQLWFELQREMIAGSEIVSFEADVIDVDGETTTCMVVRVGLFNAVCDGKYLEFAASKGQYAFLPRQPEGRYTRTASNIASASTNEQVTFGIDPTGPTGGSLLANLIQTPSLSERAAQGKEIGYAIIVVGLLGTLLALYKLFVLYVMGRAVKKQADSKDLDQKNPLGRVLKVGEEHFSKDIDTLELKLAEAIMAERPNIERYIGVVKIISVVAPLAGLLGTVTGMIVTFQQITLYGTGDPKLMAGGFSQALVTTVLGLLVAIPTTLLHSFANSSAREIVGVLEEQSTGILAERAES